MPIAVAADGTRLAYEEFGRRGAPAVLLVQGLGVDRRGWIRQRRALASRYRCIALDNRGVGGSDKPPGPYDLEVMAADAVAVLDDAGVDQAHVIGASMGGVIAQILGVRHADRVRSLTLACTACRHHPWRRQLLAEWATTVGEHGMAALMSDGARWLVGPRSLRRILPALSLFGPIAPLALSTPPESFAAQVGAILDLDDDVRLELEHVQCPTLVVAGTQDILTPLGDAEEIALLVPGAELAVIVGGAHGFLFEHAPAFNKLVVGFLARADAADDELAVA